MRKTRNKDRDMKLLSLAVSMFDRGDSEEAMDEISDIVQDIRCHYGITSKNELLAFKAEKGERKETPSGE
jgi:hypothetical protein